MVLILLYATFTFYKLGYHSKKGVSIKINQPIEGDNPIIN